VPREHIPDFAAGRPVPCASNGAEQTVAVRGEARSTPGPVPCASKSAEQTVAVWGEARSTPGPVPCASKGAEQRVAVWGEPIPLPAQCHAQATAQSRGLPCGVSPFHSRLAAAANPHVWSAHAVVCPTHLTPHQPPWPHARALIDKPAEGSEGPLATRTEPRARQRCFALVRGRARPAAHRPRRGVGRSSSSAAKGVTAGLAAGSAAAARTCSGRGGLRRRAGRTRLRKPGEARRCGGRGRPVPAQMLQGWVQSWRRCGRG
jgi:hypothetical protein